MNDLTIGKNFDEEVKNAEQKPLIWINEEVMNQKEENVRLKEKLNQLETNIDDAIGYIKYCQTCEEDIYPVIEAQKMIEILERGIE